MEILTSLKRPVIVDGAVIYNEARRCNNIIKLKKKMIREFPDLIHSKFIDYIAELWKSYDDLEERIFEIKEKKQGIPILLFLYKKGDKEINNAVEEKMNEKKQKKEIINSDLEKSKDILRKNWHLLSEDTKEMLKLVGVQGKE